jgi:hypothetical protein
VLANTDHFRLLQLLLNFLCVLYLTLSLCIFSHGFRQETEVKVTYIRPVPLEERVLLEEPVEFIPSDLSFKEDIFRVVIGQLLDFVGYCK